VPPFTDEQQAEWAVGPADVFDLYVNGRVFHVDAAKVRRLEDLERANPPMVRYMVQDHLNGETNYVLWVASAIRLARENGWLSAEPIEAGVRPTSEAQRGG
jgi:hypothetical protein